MSYKDDIICIYEHSFKVKDMKNLDSLYRALKKDLIDNNAIGYIMVSLAGIDSRVTGKDAVGHLVQEWFFDWCISKNYKIFANPKT